MTLDHHALFERYKADAPSQRMKTIHNIMADLEAAKRADDTTEYRFFLALSQDINNWHLGRR